MVNKLEKLMLFSLLILMIYLKKKTEHDAKIIYYYKYITSFK